MATSGKLNIYILEARMERDTDCLGKMDPYVKMFSREQEWKSKVCDGGGKTPKWLSQFFDIDVKYLGDNLEFKIYDEDVGKDDFIAEGQTKLSALAVNGGMDEWFEVSYKGKAAGKLHLRCEWDPK